MNAAALRAFIITFGILTILGVGLLIPRKAWAIPSKGIPYAADIMAAERTNAMPANLLARTLWQESRFRQDIISGEKKSSSGAVGIAQIIPRFHPKVDPYDPVKSIYYAAGYLSENKRRFGTWRLALAAYNMGPTALAKINRENGQNWFNFIPRETRNYVSDISRDVPSILT